MPENTPPVPVQTLQPAFVASPTPVRGSLWVHNESGRIYVVTHPSSERIRYTRIGDGYARALAPAAFLSRLRSVSASEFEQINRVMPALIRAGSAVTLRDVAIQAAVVGSTPVEASSEQHVATPPNRRTPASEPAVGVLIEPTEHDDFSTLVLSDETKQAIDSGLIAIERRPDMERIWNISRIQPMAGRCILNFYGKPGVGKTKSARAIARRLGKKLYQVDYSQVISKYYGDTAKHISAAFRQAAAADAILFFDEADSLLSRRIDMSQDGATSINQNRNVLMQELDRFNGIVICSTNLFTNYDEALLRRISRHVEFKLPDKAQRQTILQNFVENPSRCRDVEWGALAEASVGLSGGDLLNVVVNAMESVSLSNSNPDEWFLTQPILLGEIEKVKKAKDAHVKAKKVMAPILVQSVKDGN